MKQHLIVKGIDLTDAQRAHIEKKLNRLDRFFGDDVEAAVRVRAERGVKIVEVTIPLRGDVLRAQEGTVDVLNAVDEVVDKLMRQIRKHRTRLEKRVRDGAYAKAEMEDEMTIGQEARENRLVRTKSFHLEPMTTEEAISRMEMLGHTFFLFLDEKTHGIGVVYQRDDGDFGLLMPEK